MDDVEKKEAAEQESKARTWKDSSGRVDGPDTYVFGDLTRGVAVKIFGGKAHDDTEIEAAGDAAHTQVQRLALEAVRLFRLRGYVGTINMSHTVAYFTESVSVKVEADDSVGRLSPTAAAEAEAAAAAQVAEDGKAGKVFSTLVSRLERRALSWKAVSGMEGLDPNLTSSAQIGFALPVIKLGWGVSVSLTVSASTLLRWAEREAATAPAPALLEGPAEE